jgi:predicted Fe-Mo cluster-binding NifX family protein
MKICISSAGKDLNSLVYGHFGRSPYFIIWNTADKTFNVIENPNINETSGVGIKSAQLMVDMGVQAVLSGQFGPKATKVLESAKIEMIVGVSGVIKEVIESYEAGDLTKTIDTVKVDASQEEIKHAPNRILQRIGRCFRHGNRANDSMKGCVNGNSNRAGNCICPKCGEKIAHKSGMPCRTQSCPKCGSQMIRE